MCLRSLPSLDHSLRLRPPHGRSGGGTAERHPVRSRLFLFDRKIRNSSRRSGTSCRVTGEVVDIGIVRFHLLELGSGGTDAQPSGRVVAFSNSIVFQPTSSVFRQIPGTSFVWHEINLTFSPEGDYRMVQERIETAVDTALKTIARRWNGRCAIWNKQFIQSPRLN